MAWKECVIKCAKWCPPQLLFFRMCLFLVLCSWATPQCAHGLGVITEGWASKAIKASGTRGTGVNYNNALLIINYSDGSEILSPHRKTVNLSFRDTSWNKWSFYLWQKRYTVPYSAWHRKSNKNTCLVPVLSEALSKTQVLWGLTPLLGVMLWEAIRRQVKQHRWLT